MADELTLSARVRYEKSDAALSRDLTERSFSVSGTPFLDQVQTVGTSEETVDLGDVTAGGVCIVENLDTSNYVELTPSSAGSKLVILYPKGGTRLNWAIFVLSPNVSSFRGQANTGACNVRFTIFPP
jgi:hypothetical protein